MYKLREKRLKEFYTNDQVVGDAPARSESPFLMMEASTAPDLLESTLTSYSFSSTSADFATAAATAADQISASKRRNGDDHDAVSEKIRKRSTERTKRYQMIMSELANCGTDLDSMSSIDLAPTGVVATTNTNSSCSSSSSSAERTTTSRREYCEGGIVTVVETTETWRRFQDGAGAAPISQKVTLTKTTKKLLDGTVLEENEDEVIDDLDESPPKEILVIAENMSKKLVDSAVHEENKMQVIDDGDQTPVKESMITAEKAFLCGEEEEEEASAAQVAASGFDVEDQIISQLEQQIVEDTATETPSAAAAAAAAQSVLVHKNETEYSAKTKRAQAESPVRAAKKRADVAPAAAAAPVRDLAAAAARDARNGASSRLFSSSSTATSTMTSRTSSVSKLPERRFAAKDRIQVSSGAKKAPRADSKDLAYDSVNEFLKLEQQLQKENDDSKTRTPSGLKSPTKRPGHLATTSSTCDQKSLFSETKVTRKVDNKFGCSTTVSRSSKELALAKLANAKPGMVRTVEVVRTITVRDNDDKPWRTNSKQFASQQRGEDSVKKSKLHNNVMTVVQKIVDSDTCAIHGPHKHSHGAEHHHDSSHEKVVKSRLLMESVKDDKSNTARGRLSRFTDVTDNGRYKVDDGLFGGVEFGEVDDVEILKSPDSDVEPMARGASARSASMFERMERTNGHHEGDEVVVLAEENDRSSVGGSPAESGVVDEVEEELIVPVEESIVLLAVAPVEETPVEELTAPSVVALVEEAPAEESIVLSAVAPVKEAPVEEAPVEESIVSSAVAPVEETPAEESIFPSAVDPVEETPAEEDPAEEAPVKESTAPSAVAPVEETPAEESIVPSAVAPVEETPAEEAPVKESTVPSAVEKEAAPVEQRYTEAHVAPEQLSALVPSKEIVAPVGEVVITAVEDVVGKIEQVPIQEEETHVAPVEESISTPPIAATEQPCISSTAAQDTPELHTAPVAPIEENPAAPVEETITAPVEDSPAAPVQESAAVPVEDNPVAPCQVSCGETIISSVEETRIIPMYETPVAPVDESPVEMVIAPVEESPIIPSAQPCIDSMPASIEHSTPVVVSPPSPVTDAPSTPSIDSKEADWQKPRLISSPTLGSPSVVMKARSLFDSHTKPDPIIVQREPIPLNQTTPGAKRPSISKIRSTFESLKVTESESKIREPFRRIPDDNARNSRRSSHEDQPAPLLEPLPAKEPSPAVEPEPVKDDQRTKTIEEVEDVALLENMVRIFHHFIVVVVFFYM